MNKVNPLTPTVAMGTAIGLKHPVPDRIAMWARELCRINPPRLLAECRKKRLNQANFVVLRFCRVCFFWVVFSFSSVLVSVFDFFSVTYIFQHVPT